ncbi:two-component regulator propeller domain-containing protein [Reichenbachiella sp. MALMAid0571]|uniref:two-component regulator propeller domain-containing protein n=1 Tax=Reichenbachiella sp. MALMAid0571 TaxID=3143939 RepID=UPI0032DFB975
MSRCIRFILLVALIANHSLAQEIVQFKNIDHANGLSNGRVTSIIQDNQGFIWVGTKSGLNRYDGNKFKVYNQYNSTISSNDISDIMMDRSGVIWIATIGGGVSLYDSLKDNFSTFRHSENDKNALLSDEVHKIFEDSSGNIWIGTEGGLNLYDRENEGFKGFVNEKGNSSSLSHNSVWGLADDENENLWIGTYGGGLNKFVKEDSTFMSGSQLVEETNLPKLEFINVVHPVVPNQILIGTHGNGLLRLDVASGNISDMLETFPNNGERIIRTLEADSNGNIWVGTDGEGVIQIKNAISDKPLYNKFINDNRLSYSLSNNTVNCIFEDNESNIWIGTAWKGIDIIENEQNGFRFLFSDIRGYNPFPVLSIFEHEKKLWIGTDGDGLNIYDLQSTKLETFNRSKQNSVGGDYIQFVKNAGNGKYWIGTFANGLIFFDYLTKEKVQYKHEPGNSNSIPFNDVRDVIEDDLGNLWGATWGGGIFYFDIEKQLFSTYRNDATDQNSLSNDNVISLEKAKNGDIWVGTFGGGLNLLDTKTHKFTYHRHSTVGDNSITSDYIYSLLADAQNNLWIGTRDGLCLYNPVEQKFETLQFSSDTEEKSVTSILSDDDQNIWFGTKVGIFKYQTKQNEFQSFYELSGEYHINSAFKDGYGKLYFGGIDGLVSIDPFEQRRITLEPTVKLTSFKLFNKEVSIVKRGPIQKQILFEDEILLNYNQDVLTFEFAALKYPFSSHLEYAIKMENFDHDWREIGTERSATYTNLPPGDYTFKVRVKENDQWNEKYASVDLVVKSPFWATWWAYLTYIVLIVFLLYLYQKNSVAWVKMKSNLKLEQLTREKEAELFDIKQRFFTNISHEIRTPVTLMLGALNQFQANGIVNRIQKDAVDVLRRNGDHLFHLVNELLDFRKLESSNATLHVSKIDFVEFSKEIFLSYNGKANEMDIVYEFISGQEQIFLWFDPVRMEKVIYNLLSNAFKYSQAGGTIKVVIDQNDENLYFSVVDSGQGISKDKIKKIFDRFYQSDTNSDDAQGFGLGLSIAREVIRLHSGEIYVESKENEGTTFKVELPLGKDHFKEKELAPVSQKENLKIEQSVKNRLEKSVPQEPNYFENVSVLIVEDNDEIREYLVNLLKDNFKIFQANNGKTGMNLAFKEVPDLILSDVMMPEMNGIHLTEKLKADIRTSHIPIIILTARTSLIYKKEGFETGADEYITKPFDEVLLKTRIFNLLRNRYLLRKKFKTDALLEPKELPINSRDQQFVDALIKLLENNIKEGEIKADYLARELGMSHSVIYKKVKSLTGQSLVEFIRDFRLKRAAHLIRDHEDTVIEACYKVGFSDRKYFGQVFKKKFGVSPTTYAKMAPDEYGQ